MNLQMTQALQAGAPTMVSALQSAGVLWEWASLTSDAIIQMTKDLLVDKVTPHPREAEQLALMALIPSTPEMEADWLSRNADQTELTIS
jgi:hypothetical protein